MVSQNYTAFLASQVTGDPGGANEAVIRMLISIGGCVTLSHIKSVS